MGMAPSYGRIVLQTFLTFVENFSSTSFFPGFFFNKLQKDERKPILSATKSFEPPHHQAGGGLRLKPNNRGAKSICYSAYYSLCYRVAKGYGYGRHIRVEIFAVWGKEFENYASLF